MPKRELTGKMKVFLEEYLLSRNATDAARKAKYSDPDANANRLLKNPIIAAAIAAKEEDTAKRHQLTHDMLIQKLKKIAKLDDEEDLITDVVDWDSNSRISLKDKSKLTLKAMRSINKLKQIISKDGDLGVEVELKHREDVQVKAIKLLGDHLGTWKMNDPKKGEADGSDGTGSGFDPESRKLILASISKRVSKYQKRGGKT